MHDIGSIIWIAIVLIGVVSSIRKNMQRARAQRAPAPQQMAVQRPAPPPPPPPVSAPRYAATAFAMPPVDPPPRPVPPPPVAAAPAPASFAFAPAARIGTSPIRGMFGGGATLIRAIVAAEVLGPPKAFQEQTIWSPRHSEPSI
ncbi:MAG TPA: hypothetical protein VK702_05195 [Candidatus Acidoferrum sp.]|nr:hypothetical protein [Candidatus Acidoferrum sp.]